MGVYCFKSVNWKCIVVPTVIPTLGRLRREQEDCYDFKGSSDYRVRLSNRIRLYLYRKMRKKWEIAQNKQKKLYREGKSDQMINKYFIYI